MENLVGKKVELIDEFRKTKISLGIFTIKKVEGRKIEFEEDDGIAMLSTDKEMEYLKNGKKAFIHPEEVSIKLI